jgi:hypothetical protein
MSAHPVVAPPPAPFYPPPVLRSRVFEAHAPNAPRTAIVDLFVDPTYFALSSPLGQPLHIRLVDVDPASLALLRQQIDEVLLSFATAPAPLPESP